MAERRKALQGRVRGVVQGVFFRAATAREAQRLGLCGWARNTADGDVAVCICGSEPAIGEMIAWLHRGPPRARVQSVELQEIADPACTDFRILT